MIICFGLYTSFKEHYKDKKAEMQWPIKYFNYLWKIIIMDAKVKVIHACKVHLLKLFYFEPLSDSP